MHVVRVGTLQGGGPGNEEERGAPLGLTKAFDNSIIDLSAYMTSQAYDKYTLGLGLARGDPFDLSNPIVRAGRQGSPGRANHAPCPITHRAHRSRRAFRAHRAPLRSLATVRARQVVRAVRRRDVARGRRGRGRARACAAAGLADGGDGERQEGAAAPDGRGLCAGAGCALTVEW